MRAIIQRVSSASLNIDGKVESSIGYGYLILLGISDADNPEDLEWMTGKVSGLRIFDDERGLMNLDIRDVEGEAMIVSQVTLHASLRKGNRPSYSMAAKPEMAQPIYEAFVEIIGHQTGCKVVSGQFGSHMQVALVNDGPVTILIDSKNRE